MQGPMLAVDATDHMLQQQQQCIADTEHTTEVCQHFDRRTIIIAQDKYYLANDTRW